MSYSQIIDLTAEMLTPKKQQLMGQNLYELPSCTICLAELTQQIVSLACGHCFHFLCIQQHFEYKGTCPNCQKRAGSKQMRSVHFPVQINTKANAHLRQLLSSVNVSERKQVEELLKQIKEQSQKVEKLKNQMQQNQKDVIKQGHKIRELSDQLTAHKLMVNNLRIQNKKLDEQKQNLRNHLMSAQKHEAYLSSELQKYEKQEKSYQQFRKFKRLMNQKSQQIVQYKRQLQRKQTQPEQMTQLFYDMLLMKNLECLRYRDRIEEIKETGKFNETQVRKMRMQIQELKKGLREANDQKIAQRRKYQELKSKYRMLLDKAKLKGINEFPDMQDSNGFLNLKSQPLTQTTSNANLNQTQKKLDTQMKIQLPTNMASKKPSFSSGSTIGGFRKKDDKPKPFF